MRKKISLLGILFFTTMGIFTQPISADPLPPVYITRVCASGCPYSTIQDAVNSAGGGAIGTDILVATGIYTATGDQVVLIQGKRVGISGGYNANFSAYNPAKYPTIIDGEGLRAGLLISNSTNVLLTGLTIRRGWAGKVDGAVKVYSSTVNIGGNLFLDGYGNTVLLPTTGEESPPTEVNNHFTRPAKGALVFLQKSQVAMVNNVFASAPLGASAIYVLDSRVIATYNTLAEKGGQHKWAGFIATSIVTTTTLSATNNIVTGFGLGAGFGRSTALPTMSFTKTLWFSNSFDSFPGTVSTSENVFGDPRFVSPNTNNFDLLPGSAAIGQGVCFWTITYDILFRGRRCPSAIGAYEPFPPRAYLPFIGR